VYWFFHRLIAWPFDRFYVRNGLLSFPLGGTLRVDKTRKSAKGTIAQYASELLSRPNDPESPAKLMAIQTIALRMGWNDLYKKLRFREASGQVEVTEKWWNK